MAKSNTNHPEDGVCIARGEGWDCDDRATPRTAYCQYHRQQQWSPEGFTRRSPIHRDVTERDLEGRKKCIKCLKWLAEDCFYKCKHTRDKLQPHCRDCTKWGQLQLKFGVTEEQYWKILKQQGGVCRICKEPPGTMKLGVDHDHTCCTGNRTCGRCVRGLLCSTCNTALGKFRDSPEILESAILYLEETRGQGKY